MRQSAIRRTIVPDEETLDQDEVEAHRRHGPAATDEGDDDVEAHRRHGPAATDEGDDDDVEAHRRHGPA
jgi:hypothetical protein